jgi:crotonobetainyl-CoA:carnitine CoA-transferase CaiB-like acyl-CoA transferase
LSLRFRKLLDSTPDGLLAEANLNLFLGRWLLTRQDPTQRRLSIFAERDVEAWKGILGRQEGQWSVVQTPAEALEDPQAHANEYIQTVKYDNGATLPLVTVPMRIDGGSVPLTPAPELGAHTEEVLLELGRDWDQIIELKQAGAIS